MVSKTLAWTTSSVSLLIFSLIHLVEGTCENDVICKNATNYAFCFAEDIVIGNYPCPQGQQCVQGKDYPCQNNIEVLFQPFAQSVSSTTAASASPTPPVACTSASKYPAENCNQYYECVPTLWWFNLNLFNCSAGQAFSSTELTCVNDTSCNPETAQLASDTRTEQTIQSTTESTTESTTAVSTTESTTELTTQSTTESTTQSTTASTTQSTSASTTQSTTESTTQSTTDSTTESTTELTTESTTQPTTESTTQSTSESTTQSTTDSTTESTTELTTESTTQSTSESTTQSTTESTTELTTESTTQSTTDSTTQPTTASTSVTTELTTDSTTESTSESTTQSTTDSTTSTELTPTTTAASDPVTPPAECTSARKYPAENCNQYYECVAVMWWYNLILNSCSTGQAFNAENLTCVADNTCGVTATTVTTTPSTTSTITSTTSTTVKTTTPSQNATVPSSCDSPEKYPASNCNQYYECVEVMYWYEMVLQSCGNGQSFNSTSKTCVTDSSCSI